MTSSISLENPFTEIGWYQFKLSKHRPKEFWKNHGMHLLVNNYVIGSKITEFNTTLTCCSMMLDICMPDKLTVLSTIRSSFIET